MNLLGASRGIRFHPGNIEDGFALVTPPGGPDLHITIQMADRPLDMARFARSRDLSHRKLAQSDLRAAIETHIGYFKIRVVKGAVPMGDSPETNDFMTRIGMNSETAEEFETRLLLARGAADFLAQNSNVDVMHWVQSDKLYPAAHALLYGHTALPLGLLYTQPRFQSAGKDDQGKLLVGFQLFGAEHFLGRALLLAPNSAGTQNNLDLATALLAHCYRENTLPGNGSLVGLDAGNCAAIAHIAPSEKLPFGAIRLTRITGHKGPLDMVLDGTPAPRSDFPSTLAEAAMNVSPPNTDGAPAQSRAQTAAEIQALYDRVDAKTNGADKAGDLVTPGWNKLEQKLSKVIPGKGGLRSAPANAPAPKKSHKIITYVLSALVIAKSLPIGALLILYHYRSGLSLKAAAYALAAALVLPSLQQLVPRTTDLAGDPAQSTQMISLK